MKKHQIKIDPRMLAMVMQRMAMQAPQGQPVPAPGGAAPMQGAPPMPPGAGMPPRRF